MPMWYEIVKRLGTPDLNEKSMLDCARTLSEASSLNILEHLPHSSDVFHSHSSSYCQQGISNLAEVGLKLFPLKTYM